MAQKLEGSLLKAYKQDDDPNKMFLAYKVCMTSEGRPWVSSVVRKTRMQIAQDPSLNYEYTPVMGMKSFIQASLNLLFGKNSQVIVENRAGGVQTVGDSGAFQLGAQFLKTWCQNSQIVYIVSSQKEPHGLIFQDMGFTVYEHTFWDSAHLCLDPNMLLDVVEHAPHGCIFVIGSIGNCRLTSIQWTQLMTLMKSKEIFPFFDIPYQGLSTGDLEEDAIFLQYFVSQGFEFFCSQSLSKNFGIYDEGVGTLVVVALNNQLLLRVLSQLTNFARALWLNPPTTGARIITSVLCNPAMQGEWRQSLEGVVENIMMTKEKVKEKLRLLGTPGSWDHITEQKGTHSYLGLNLELLWDSCGSPEMLTLPTIHNSPWARGEQDGTTLGSEMPWLSPAQQVEYLISKKHIYIPKNGRINFTCINSYNIDYITASINEAVCFTKDSEK
ncbi:putative aspartate aminotransferase, cytoplasmic 2 isoform X2 [Odocoileus virginianus]|nr:putative aspartate aminotransferase, cytoplasmic 2 isoform X2 [Odocoileus virginianus texanus]